LAPAVERPQRQLRARLADRLRGQDADRRPDVDEPPRRQVGAVAAAADATGRPARERASHAQLLQVQLGQHARLAGADDLALANQLAAGLVVQSLHADAALDARGERALVDALDEAARGAAVLLRHDDLLAAGDELARQVAGLGGADALVGQPLPAAARGGEV